MLKRKWCTIWHNSFIKWNHWMLHNDNDTWCEGTVTNSWCMCIFFLVEWNSWYAGYESTLGIRAVPLRGRRAWCYFFYLLLKSYTTIEKRFFINWKFLCEKWHGLGEIHLGNCWQVGTSGKGFFMRVKEFALQYLPYIVTFIHWHSMLWLLIWIGGWRK